MDTHPKSGKPEFGPVALFAVFMSAGGIAKLGGAHDVSHVQGVVGLVIACLSTIFFFVRRSAPRRHRYLFVAGTTLLLGVLWLSA